MAKTYNKSDILSALSATYEHYGRDFTCPEFTEYTGISQSPMYSMFDGFIDAKLQAGIKHNDYKTPLNVEYFEQINTPEKAYWLGVLAGDGTVKSEPKPTVALSVHQKDDELVTGFFDAVESGYSITYHSQKAYGQIYNPRFIDHLRNHGIDEHKTKSGSIPDIDDELFASYVRGLSDADGHYQFKSKRGVNIRFVLTGSINRLDQIAERIPVETNKYTTKDSGVRQLAVYKYDSIIKLIEWMYPDGAKTVPALGRKRKTAMEILEYAKTR